MTDPITPGRVPVGATPEGDAIVIGAARSVWTPSSTSCARTAGGLSCRRGRRWPAWWPIG